MNRSSTRQYGRRRPDARSRRLVTLLAVVVLVGVALQITMLARISGRQKQQAAMDREIRALNAQVENMNLSMSSFHNLDRVAARAKQLGMGQPTDAQIRVVNLPGLQDTSTQSAEAIGAEEMK